MSASGLFLDVACVVVDGVDRGAIESGMALWMSAASTCRCGLGSECVVVAAVAIVVGTSLTQ